MQVMPIINASIFSNLNLRKILCQSQLIIIIIYVTQYSCRALGGISGLCCNVQRCIFLKQTYSTQTRASTLSAEFCMLIPWTKLSEA
jgi:hypothetical protein